jgi:hypothetical protein
MSPRSLLSDSPRPTLTADLEAPRTPRLTDDLATLEPQP